MLKTDFLIIGGGLSGLSATWQLRLAGINASLVEARGRYGGRILTQATENGADCDLGPSWFWPGQPLVASLLEHFKIPFYQQFDQGAVLFQHLDGHIESLSNPSPMSGSRRIEGGIKRLTDMLVNEIDPAHRFLSHEVTAISINKGIITVDVAGPSANLQLQARHVVLALPPRLAAGLKYVPELPAETLKTLAATPTWMAGHAKFFALYSEPFWRKRGLCGTVMSQRGPLAEIHDASPHSGNIFSLFGFSGLDAESRTRIGRSQFIKQALEQLAQLFGEQAKTPESFYFHDWSQEKFTASPADQAPQTSHPRYGLRLRAGSVWQGKLDFISSETAVTNGGLIEGALEAGLGFSRRITGKKMPVLDDALNPHTANMSWDWL